MKRIKYSDSAYTLRFEYPREWPAESITGIDISVHDREATELLAATAATLGKISKLKAINKENRVIPPFLAKLAICHLLG